MGVKTKLISRGNCAVLSHSVVSDSFWLHALSNPPGSSVHGDSPGKNTGVSCHALLQGIFPTQGSNPSLPRCRWILYCLSHQGSPRKLLGSLSLLQGIFLTQGSNWGLLHCRLFLKFRQCHGETFFRCSHMLKASIFYSQGFLPLSLALHKVKYVYPLELINIHKTSLFMVLFYE